jgi:4-amino-4-deoxy-L-arabinose transferase-like glycosyltransferase
MGDELVCNYPEASEEADPSVQRGASRLLLLERIALLVILLGAAAFRLWKINQNGYGNLYYAAAVRSMLQSGVNFVFGSFDPAGFVTLDKPPVALWIQTASAALFGYSGLSLLVPQALVGVGSVLILYWLVRRVAGAGAALVAALVLAITPISVAVDRDNLPDTALVFVLLLAAWAWSRAVETGRWRSLLVAAALVGVGFNVKMLAAFVVLPAFCLLYLAYAPGGWWKRIGRLTGATIALMAVSLTWIAAVAATPADYRPYIGGSKTNSALELAVGYNGLGRIFGGLGNFRRGRGDRPPPRTQDSDPEGKAKTGEDEQKAGHDGPPDPAGGSFPPFLPVGPGSGPPPWVQGPGGPPGGPPGERFEGPPGGFGGAPGIQRFAEPQLAGQITWLFPLALVGGAAAAGRARWRRPVDPILAALLLWGGWLVTHWVVFSWAQGIFHEYYTTMMAPALAALAGIGMVAIWREWFHGGRWRGVFFVAALLLTAGWQGFVVYRFPDVRTWLLPTILGGVALGTVAALAARWLPRRWRVASWMMPAAGIGFAALLVGPVFWSLACLTRPLNATMPAGGPSRFAGRFPGRPGGPPPFAFEARAERNSRLIAFLRANHHGERMFVAAPASMTVAPIIIETGEPAVALGGFMGGDPIVTREDFAHMVEEGQVRFVLIGGPGGRFGRGRNRQPGPPPALPGGAAPPGGMPDPPATNEVMDWVRAHGKEVDRRLWQPEEPAEGTDPDAGTDGRRFRGPWRGMERLYDCRPELGLSDVLTLR